MTLSLLGLYQYNNALFDGLKIPGGVDKNKLVNNLLAECAEFEIIYPDPEFMANMISIWSGKEFPQWEKLYNTTNYEYDPISNYDRTEEWTDTATGNTNSIGKTAGFNSAELVTSGGGESTATSENKHSGRIKGNIGVTTTQQMIEAERDVVKFNIYDYIIDSFKRRFCLLIY